METRARDLHTGQLRFGILDEDIPLIQKDEVVLICTGDDGI